MLELEVIEEAGPAAAILDPLRARILAALLTTGSAASVAQLMGLPRQKVNYHLRSLEAHGLVEAVEERIWGGLTERLFLATARSYVISPSALGVLARSPESTGDRLSASYLVALAARAVREVGSMLRRVERSDKRLATLAMDVDIHFGTASERAAFADELAEHVKSLAGRYHRPEAPGGRTHRLVVLAYPGPLNIAIQEAS